MVAPRPSGAVGLAGVIALYTSTLQHAGYAKVEFLGGKWRKVKVLVTSSFVRAIKLARAG